MMTTGKIRQTLFIALFLSAAIGCSGATPPDDVTSSDRFDVREIVSGLGVPWGMTFVSATDMIITERGGGMKRLDLETGTLSDIAGAPEVFAVGQGGLLDVAVSPDGDWLYLTYAKPIGDKAATALARARLEGDRLVDLEELFVSNHRSDQGRHFGSRVVFDGRGHLFLSLGDRGERDSAQDLADHSGSIIRLNLDGSVPEDNPFVDTGGAQPEIWSYGHRNPQGLVYDADRNRLWAMEHGPRGGDEINLVEAGKNYGWPVISYGKEYMSPVMVGEGTHREGMEQPIKHYVPSIAPSGLVLYNGDVYPGLQGSLLSGALKLMHLNQVVIDSEGNAVEENRYLEDKNQRIRNVVEGPDGKLYLSTDSGKIWELVGHAQN